MAFTMTDRARLKAKLEAECEGSTAFTDAKAAVSASNTTSVMYTKSGADAMAADVSTVWSFYVARACKITNLYVIPNGAATANDTNYFTLAAKYDDGAGGADTTIGSFICKITAGTGNWVAGTNLTNATVAATPVEVAAGQTILIDIAKTGSGLVCPACMVQLEVEWT